VESHLVHDAAHDAFIALPAYAIPREDEVKLSGERDKIAYLRHYGTHPRHDADFYGEEELSAQFHVRRMEEKMNDRWNENKMNYKEDFEALRRGGFTEHEIQQLSQLRRDRIELELSRTSTEYQRLAFVRWLVATGKLSDQLA